ncbi:MAG TPA: extracellular solute-binding protein [Microlunatus sp.]|nr:extracellular solute-binding protein [Microlunatus sp.]
MSALHRRGFLGLSGAAALFAAGCTGSVGGGAGQPQAPSNTLRLFTYEGDETIDRFKGRIAEFDAEAGLTTTVDSLPGSGAAVYPDKLRTELLGGKGPDVWRIWGGEIGRPFVTAKQAADLAPYYDRLGWNDRIDGNAVAGMTFDGVKAGVPLNAAALGAFYNRELLQKAKIDSDPQSYAELEEFNEKLVAAGITPAGLGGKYGWHIMRLFEYLLEHTAGPELHDQLLTGAASWDTPEVVEAFTLFKKWQDSGWVPEGALGLDPSDIKPAFIQGKTAYTITGPWIESGQIAASGKSPDEFGTFVLPTDQDQLRFSGFVEGYMLNARSGNLENAAKLLDFLARPETQKALQNPGATVAGAEPDPKTHPMAAQWAEYRKEHAFYTIQDQAFPKKEADQYFTVQSDILQGSISPAQAAKRMQEIVSAWAKG